MDHLMVVPFTGAKHRAGKGGVVRGVGEMLRFEAEACAMTVGDAVFADGAAIEKISAVKLQAGLVGENFHGAT